jgi:VWFA-related protein
VQTALVNVPVIVTDPQGQYIAGLGAPDFKLFQDGLPQTVDLFGALQEPLKVALMLDTSKSTITVLGRIKKAASNFLKQLRPHDQAMIVSFDSEINLVCYLTDDQRELEEALKDVQVGSSVGTRMRDAILDMTTRRFQRTQGRRAMVILTDGQDNGSQTTAPDLIAAVSGSDIPIYSVFYHVDPRELAKKLFGVSMPRSRTGGRSWEHQEDEAAAYLRKLSEASAGRLFLSGTEDLKTTFTKVTEELRHQYLLAFYPQKDKLDGKPHALRVEVDRPGVQVRSRNSYRAGP